jgi:hypothetical protein
MASGHVNRVNRPNTWLHRPMLQMFKKVLANSEPSTHGGKADIAFEGQNVPLMTQSGPFGKTQNGCDLLHSLDPNSFVKLQWGKA